MSNQKAIERAVDNAMDKITAIDDHIIGDVIGVAQAVGGLRKQLDKINICLDERQFEEASRLGYGEVSSEFIFLQRALGALQSSEHDKQALISEIAVQSGSGIYEEIEPYVSRKMPSTQKLDESEKKKTGESITIKTTTDVKQRLRRYAVENDMTIEDVLELALSKQIAP